MLLTKFTLGIVVLFKFYEVSIGQIIYNLEIKKKTLVGKCCTKESAIAYLDGGIDCRNYSANSKQWKGFFYDQDALRHLSTIEVKTLNPFYDKKSLNCTPLDTFQTLGVRNSSAAFSR